MIIEYTLLPLQLRAVKETKETCLIDIEKHFELKFNLPEKGEHIVTLKGQDTKEKTLRLDNVQCAIPNEMVKPQIISISVVLLKDGKAVKRWICPALSLINLNEQGKALRQVIDDFPELPERVNEQARDVEKVLERIGILEKQLETKEQQIQELSKAYVAAKEAIKMLESRMNKYEEE